MHSDQLSKNLKQSYMMKMIRSITTNEMISHKNKKIEIVGPIHSSQSFKVG